MKPNIASMKSKLVAKAFSYDIFPKTINIIIVTQLPNSNIAPILRKPPAMNVSGYWYLETIKAIPNKNIAILKGKGTNLYE